MHGAGQAADRLVHLVGWRGRVSACIAARVDCSLPELLRPAGSAACCDETQPKLQQERAWSSPIFYQP